MRYILYTTVFVTGMAVLVIEITAVRTLSPFFGSSLSVLSSVLTVILGALSVGYYVGGKLSDRIPHHEPLFALIAISGVVVLLSQYLGMRILPYTEGIFSYVSGPLILGTLLFFAPAFLLGIVSPYIIKIQSLGSTEAMSGSVVGATFFWGTCGSIAGSLTTGFIFVPFLGVTASVVGTGVALVFLGIFGLIGMAVCKSNGERSVFAVINQYARFILLVLVTATFIFVGIYTTRIPYNHTVLYEADGLYSKLFVFEAENGGRTIRALKQDSSNSSAVYLDSYDLVFGYTQFAEFYRVLKPDTSRFLMLGAGTYTIPRTLVARDSHIEVDVSDLEPQLLELSQKYFDLADISRIHTHTVDSRVFLQQSTTTYDVVFEDVFGTDLGIPAHLATREFFEVVKKDLVPNGIFIINYIGTLNNEAPTLTGSLVRTLTSVFPVVHVSGLDGHNREARQNIMFVARNGTDPIDLSQETIAHMDGEIISLQDAEVPLSRFDFKNELVLTDDRAPVEYLMLAQQ